jgi:AraC-like DNA-binding protein
MIKDLINIELKDLPIEGLDVHIIKKYVVKTDPSESFNVSNLTLLLIKSGKFKIQLKEITQNLSARDFMVIPRDSFCTLLEVQDKLQLFMISFSSEFSLKNCLKKEFIETFYFFVGKIPVKITLDEKEFLVLSLIYKLICFVNKDAGKNGLDLELQRISFNLFFYELRLIYAKYTSETSQQFTRKESLIIQFLTILAIHYKKKHNAKFYAGALFVTPAHLNKIVKQVTGKTVKKIIVEAIINEAEQLLEDSQLTIIDIAEELEFTTANSFTVFFKKHTSISPSQYRSNAMEIFKKR